ncbi:HNH endonuclease [Natronosalvus caseinilyticus]|uniref:HNH endonuclease n=1 Tax=Natronosalvus caseinilyticus TaxID=2953747 RepID=UPI0028B06BE8|nr:HNH endonuclease [Natronosalvus caseinilyticus]
MTVECTVCTDSIERYPSAIGDVVVCGEDCRRRWLSESFTGEGHPNWKGGDTGPYGKGWAAIRRQALERDGYQCVHCGTTKGELGRNPDVHHLIPVRAFAEADSVERADAHVLENAVSLCLPCHRRAEFCQISVETLRADAGLEPSGAFGELLEGA